MSESAKTAAPRSSLRHAAAAPATGVRGSASRAEVSLDAPVGRVEAQLEALHGALRANDPLALEAAAGDLQRALATAVGQFREAARRGGVPGGMRQRLALASARVAAQRESLARATASLDRAIEVLMPTPTPVYESAGHSSRPRSSGCAQA